MANNLFPVGLPITDTQTNETSASRPKFGRSWRFDFDTGDFVSSSTGALEQTDGLNAYIEWAKKVLRTPRYRHLIYPRWHGQEYDNLARRDLTPEVVESEVQRITTETLMVDPRTSSVDGFTFEWRGSDLYFRCNVITALGKEVTLDGAATGVK
ncbi:DUF2634 domain-containing protein [Heliobacillus mobilis]|uniref:DUF2634 domain-containing protein n=1 Tax=Heliobacterium mobile TaxID=28064 RepID=A0A6I3SCK4_HELMO|nr:DUF2634 domain-containing protein [Heliobacterium mobile]MTV47769.1 DUF2634 domain-containing protein [Heliobacterium mobile]